MDDQGNKSGVLHVRLSWERPYVAPGLTGNPMSALGVEQESGTKSGAVDSMSPALPHQGMCVKKHRIADVIRMRDFAKSTHRALGNN